MNTPSSWDLINRIDQSISAPHSWTQKLEAIAEVILSSDNYDLVWLLTLPPLPAASVGVLQTNPASTPIDTISLSDTSPPISEDWPPKHSILAHVLRTGLPLFGPHINDDTNTLLCDLGNLLRNHKKINIQAIIPLKANNIGFGILIVGRRQDAKGLTSSQEELLKHTTRHLALTLHNVNLTQIAQRQAEQLATLNKIARTITSSLNLDEALRRTVASIDDMLDVEAGALLLTDPNTQELYFKLILRGAESVISAYRLQPDEGIAGWVVKHQRPLIVNNPRSDPRFLQRIDQETGFVTKSVLCSPIIVNGKTIGALEVLNKRQGIFSPEDQQLLTSMTASLGIALQNSQLYRRLQEESKNKTRLLDAVQKRTSALKDIDMLGEKLLARNAPEGILETILDTLPQVLPADVHGVIIDLPGFTKMGLKLPKNAPRTMIAETQQTMLDALNHQPSSSTKKLRLEDPYIVYGDKLIHADWQLRSQLTLPILTLSGSLGALHLAYIRQSAVSADMIHLFSLVVSRISGILENTRLITEIEQERARLAAILSSTADGILVVDRSDHIILDNPAAYTILERTHSQIGKSLNDTIDNQDLLGLFQTAKASGGAAGEFSYTSDKIYYARISPVYAGQDAIIGWVAVMQDVSAFKKLNEAKDSFVSDVSHDLRSPLSSIALASHLLKLTGPTTEQQEELLDTINKNIERMTGLIEDLLDAGKIEADIGMEMDEHLVNPLIFEAAAQLATQANQKRIDYQIDLSNHLYTIRCNPGRLQQVVANLTSNAIKYTPENGNVTVRLFSKDNNLLFQVADSGYGIPQKDQARIFDKFYRVKEEYMIGKEGSGLGLAISKSIIEKHNGKIWVESAPNRGSTFTIMLPLIRIEKDAAKV